MITDINEKLEELEIKQNIDINSDIRSWYVQNFPDDELGTEIHSGVSFQSLYDNLSSNDIYGIIGIDDSTIRERCFSKLAELVGVEYSVIYDKWLNAEIPDNFNPIKQPVVTILWSENMNFESGQKMPLHKAEKLFAYLDENYPQKQGYDKTQFRIDYMYDGVRNNYVGRYDIGDRENGIVNHIENYFKYNLRPEFLESVKATMGQEGVDEIKENASKALEFFIPYLKLHINLSEIEDTANKALNNTTVSETDKAYYSAMCDYVHNSRVMLNTSFIENKLPEPPKKEDFSVNQDKAQSKKPSIKKQLEKDKTTEKPKKQSKKKTQELEV